MHWLILIRRGCSHGTSSKSFGADVTMVTVPRNHQSRDTWSDGCNQPWRDCYRWKTPVWKTQGFRYRVTPGSQRIVFLEHFVQGKRKTFHSNVCILANYKHINIIYDGFNWFVSSVWMYRFISVNLNANHYILLWVVSLFSPIPHSKVDIKWCRTSLLVLWWFCHVTKDYIQQYLEIHLGIL